MGVWVVCLNPPLGPKHISFMGKFMKKLGKPLLTDLNPTSRNPGSAPAFPISVEKYCENTYAFYNIFIFFFFLFSNITQFTSKIFGFAFLHCISANYSFILKIL